MNCFEARRRLLASPRHRAADLEAHLAECAQCSRLTSQLANHDQDIAEAALVPVPDALAHRVLRARRPQPMRRYAIAALIVVASSLLGLALPPMWDAWTQAPSVQALGPTHPAIAAISFVVEQQPALLEEGRAGDPAIMAEGLKRLGLSMKAGVTVDYVGKCYMPETDCDHIVLNTPDGQVSVILVPDYPVSGRVIVADRRMTALLSPAGTGGYIVVAQSPKVARRTEKLFVKG
jgi:hypothetical protein